MSEPHAAARVPGPSPATAPLSTSCSRAATGPSAASSSTAHPRAAAIRPWHIGEGAHPAMVAAAARCGYDLTGHRGVQVSPDLLEWADTVLTVDQSVHGALTAQITGPATMAKVHLYLDGQDVPDPWEQPEEAFIACVTVVEAGANRHLQPATT
ncbi:hypothetical protein AB0442_12320 [Kitasatospora sp. NPDC085895]|uniref:arsenate reductase/protein-tyrosine-phosphatase family protein n=1 Tax=Kitasatospora sp. NPDC085895 TaxID=3155057 RepID=UPI00344D6024